MTRNEGTTQNVNVVNTHDAGARQAIDVVNNANQEMRSAAEILNQRLLQQQAHIEQREGKIARTFAAQEEARQREKWTHEQHLRQVQTGLLAEMGAMRKEFADVLRGFQESTKAQHKIMTT